MARSKSAATLRRTILALMALRNETQEQLGEALGLTQGQISRKLAGQAAITLCDCDAIAEHYVITVPELLSGPTVAISRHERKRTKGGPTDADPPSPLG